MSSGRYEREEFTTLAKNFRLLCRKILRRDVHKIRNGAKAKKNG